MNAVTTTENNALAPRGMGFDLSPQTFEQAMKFSHMLAESDLVPKDFRGKPGNCLIAMQWGSELGLKPLQALSNIAVVNGRAALWGDAVIALVRSSPLCEYVQESDDGHTATCRAKRRGEPEQVVTFSMDDAKQAGLAGKQGPWSQYPKRMRQMRARAFALRDVFPDVLRGMPVAEEVQDMPPERHMGMADEVTPAAQRVAAQPAEWAADRWANGLVKWVDGIVNGGKSIEDVLAWLRSKATVSEAQEKQLREEVAKHSQAAAPSVNPDELAKSMQEATDLDTLYELASRMDAIEDLNQRQRVGAIFDARVAELEGQP
ncbi:hypothetical protein LJR074_003425 [Acidovorax sp. LjRoot74]|uniref:recombinase RecT n=1 Tax=Acidovorax sp. LjRoot74 TaxID=3342337 RepID=UPI003ECDB10C